MKSILQTICLLVMGSAHAAVHLSPDGQGQAISFPFYSVAPNINTYLTINNHSDQAKALKIHIKESKYLTVIKSFNLYLKGNDMWSMAMGGIDDKLYAASQDYGSCATGITVGSSNLDDINIPLPPHLDWWEWQTGAIEVVEMGEIEPELAAELFSDSNASPCAGFDEAWADGQGRWQLDSGDGLLPASGGVSGSIGLLDVINGYSFAYDPLVFTGFHEANTILHRHPEAPEPNLSSGTNTSLVLHQGEAFHTVWPTGYEAISALLMKTTLENNHELNQFIAAETEWVVSMPTMGYHWNATDTTVPFSFLQENPNFPGFIKFPPFATIYNSDSAILNEPEFGCIGTISCAHSKSAAVFTYSFYLQNQPVPESSVLAGVIQEQAGLSPRMNHEIHRVNQGSLNDLGRIKFDLYRFDTPFSEEFSIPNARGKDVSSGQTHRYYGLPATGFSMTRYFNANAQPGLLAAYAKTHTHTGQRRIEVVTDD